MIGRLETLNAQKWIFQMQRLMTGQGTENKLLLSAQPYIRRPYHPLQGLGNIAEEGWKECKSQTMFLRW